MSAPFAFDRSWDFEEPPEELWAVLSDTDSFPRWWTWLRTLEVPGLEPGAVAEAVIQSPLPYSLRVSIEVERVVAPELVETYVRGDLDGVASLAVTPVAGGGSSARLWWELELRNGLLRGAATIGRPLMVWAHDRIVDVGIEQFRRRALGGR